MPRPNPLRTVFAEDHVAARITIERERRGWTLEGLAKRMTDAGCPLAASAIYKTEQGQPRRRIVTDELVTYSSVFGIPVDELLLPPEVAASKELGRLVVEWNYAREAAADAEQERDDAWDALRGFVANNPDAEGSLERIMKTWASVYFDDEQKAGAVAVRMFEATGSKKWADRVRAEIEGAE